MRRTMCTRVCCFLRYSAYDFQCVRHTHENVFAYMRTQKGCGIQSACNEKRAQFYMCMCMCVVACVCIHGRISARMQTGLAKLRAIEHFSGVARQKCTIKISAVQVRETERDIGKQQRIIMLMKMRSEWRSSWLS